MYPAHGAGSLCGRNMRAERSSTIGTERLTNYALQIKSRDEFIRQMTTNLPARPDYFLEDAAINRAGRCAPDRSAGIDADFRADTEVHSIIAQGGIALDVRAGRSVCCRPCSGLHQHRALRPVRFLGWSGLGHDSRTRSDRRQHRAGAARHACGWRESASKMLPDILTVALKAGSGRDTQLQELPQITVQELGLRLHDKNGGRARRPPRRRVGGRPHPNARPLSAGSLQAALPAIDKNEHGSGSLQERISQHDRLQLAAASRIHECG